MSHWCYFISMSLSRCIFWPAPIGRFHFGLKFRLLGGFSQKATEILKKNRQKNMFTRFIEVIRSQKRKRTQDEEETRPKRARKILECVNEQYRSLRRKEKEQRRRFLRTTGIYTKFVP